MHQKRQDNEIRLLLGLHKSNPFNLTRIASTRLCEALDTLQTDLNPPPNAQLLGYVPGKLSLEWMRRLDCESVTELLTSNLEGFGEKSAACVTLLCFHWKSFPVDVNVARICARLGWIPLKSAESIEDLDLYAPELEVHKYLKARLSHFDFDTLYELHYLMITMGKVFCTKTNPRCSACPLRQRCEYACNGGKRFEKLVSIKRQKRKKDGVSANGLKSATTPTKSDRHLRSSGPLLSEQPPETKSVMRDVSYTTLESRPSVPDASFLTPLPVPKPETTVCTSTEDALKVEVASTLADIEDLCGSSAPRSLHDSARSLKYDRSSQTCSRITDDQSKVAQLLETSDYEITRIVHISQEHEATVTAMTDVDITNNDDFKQSLPLNKEIALQVLKADSNTTDSRIRWQYKQLSMLIHPDKCKHTQAATAFSFLSQAYQSLINKAEGDSSSTEMVEDPQTESFVVSRLPLAIRTPLTFTHSRNILHAFHFKDARMLYPLFPSHLSALYSTEVFLLPDPRLHPAKEAKDQENAEVFVLVTAKDAMESRFPLNGTFFQTNELFVIDGLSLSVLQSLLHSTSDGAGEVAVVRIYFGTSVSRITLGMGTAEITHLFNHSYVCVRNFNYDTKQSAKLYSFLSP